MASRICELDTVPHALLESCQRPFQIRGTVNGPISKVSKLADGEDILVERRTDSEAERKRRLEI